MRRLIFAGLCLVCALGIAGCAPSMYLDSSPNGQHLLFSWYQWTNGSRSDEGLALIRDDGTGFQRLTGSARFTHPLWSPDGRWIAVEDHDYSSWFLKLYNLASNDSRVMLKAVHPLAWREDSQRIAGSQSRGNQSEEIVWLTPAGETVFRTPLPGQGLSVSGAVWVQGTDAILVTAVKDGQDLYLVEPGQVRQITHTSDVVGMTVTAGGQRFLWARKSIHPQDPLVSLFAYDRLNGVVERLPFHATLADLRLDPGFVDVFVYKVLFSPAAGGLLLHVATTNVPSSVIMSALERASRLAPGKQGDPLKQVRGYEAVYVAKDGGTVLRLVRRTAPGRLWPEGDEWMNATWTRDGGRIAVLHLEKARASLLVFNADGTGKTLLLRSAQR